VTLPLPCIPLVQSFFVLQFPTHRTTVTAAANITTEITGTGIDDAAAVVVVNSTVVIAVAVTAVVTVVQIAVAGACTATAATTAAATAATVTVYIHAAAYASDILSSILTGSAHHPAFSLLLHTRCCTIHTLRLATNHTSTVHTTTLTRLKQHVHIFTNTLSHSDYQNEKKPNKT
jgi:hypothetical protein